ncbi:MAG: hypothetical protein BHW64_05820 [Candidatus Melainabacteria bacterium LEY3_CP_29_8]|nr:MAG: hypothetical protein BHW64_05820 [Candidatus Melainabacteria bacterium LEY3_CP_29_8]
MNYGNYNVSHPQSYEIAQKKQEKENKSSVLGTVAKVTGATVGIGATLLVGYGMINKGQGKKVVQKTKNELREVTAQINVSKIIGKFKSR